jgi:septum site-determining protein MinC
VLDYAIIPVYQRLRSQVASMNDLITIKGGREGLRMLLNAEAEWSALLVDLTEQLRQRGSFFAGAKLVVDVGDRQIDEAQFNELLALMQQHGVEPETINAAARESRNAARAAGIAARPAPQPLQRPAGATESDALLLTRTVRSGQVVRHHGHLTLVGDVNPGAEIIAVGSVIVWGRLRGVVHAGALGDTHAIVCAIELRPTQLRIADQFARTPEGASTHVPEVARLDQGQIVVEAWDVFRKGTG